MISFRHKGNFSKTEKYLRNMKAKKLFSTLNKYGQEGVAVLMSARRRGKSCRWRPYFCLSFPGFEDFGAILG